MFNCLLLVLRNFLDGGKTTRYGEVAELLGCSPRQADQYFVDIDDWFKDHNLPPFSTLVVNAETQMSGDGYYKYHYPELKTEKEKMEKWIVNYSKLLENKDQVEQMVYFYN